MKYSACLSENIKYRRSFLTTLLSGTLVACAAGKTDLLESATNIAKDLNADGSASEGAEIVQKTPTGKELYIFFISTSESYSQTGLDKVITEMRNKFTAFGKSIGENNVAVWVNQRGSSRLSARHGKFVADRYRLFALSDFSYSNGPYIIVTNAHPQLAFSEQFSKLKPDSTEATGPFVVSISLNNVGAEYVVDALNGLEQSIRRNEVTKLGAARLQTWLSFWTWYDANKSTVADVLKETWVAVLGVVLKK